MESDAATLSVYADRLMQDFKDVGLNPKCYWVAGDPEMRGSDCDFCIDLYELENPVPRTVKMADLVRHVSIVSEVETIDVAGRPIRRVFCTIQSEDALDDEDEDLVWDDEDEEEYEDYDDEEEYEDYDDDEE